MKYLSKDFWEMSMQLFLATDGGALLNDADAKLVLNCMKQRHRVDFSAEEKDAVYDLYSRFMVGQYDNSAWLFGIPCLTRASHGEVFWRGQKVRTMIPAKSVAAIAEQEDDARVLAHECALLDRLGYRPSPITLSRPWCRTTPDSKARWHRIMEHLWIVHTHNGVLAGMTMLPPKDKARFVWWHNTKGAVEFEANGHHHHLKEVQKLATALGLEEDRSRYQTYDALAEGLDVLQTQSWSLDALLRPF